MSSNTVDLESAGGPYHVVQLVRPPAVAYGIVAGLQALGWGLLALALVLPGGELAWLAKSIGAAFVVAPLLALPLMLAQSLHPRWRIELYRDRIVMPVSRWWFRHPVDADPRAFVQATWLDGLWVETEAWRVKLPASWLDEDVAADLLLRLKGWRFGSQRQGTA